MSLLGGSIKLSPYSLITYARQLSERLERLSADSIYAHRASGYRGTLLRCLEDFNDGVGDLNRLQWVVDASSKILIDAGREIS